MAIAKIEELYKQAVEQVAGLNDLDLTREDKKSRITFSNAKRVVALEQRKKYVLAHLPELKFLKAGKAIEMREKKAFIKSFLLTHDGRGFTYARLYTVQQLPEFLEVVKIAAQHNK